MAAEPWSSLPGAGEEVVATRVKDQGEGNLLVLPTHCLPRGPSNFLVITVIAVLPGALCGRCGSQEIKENLLLPLSVAAVPWGCCRQSDLQQP